MIQEALESTGIAVKHRPCQEGRAELSGSVDVSALLDERINLRSVPWATASASRATTGSEK